MKTENEIRERLEETIKCKNTALDDFAPDELIDMMYLEIYVLKWVLGIDDK